MSDLKFFYQMIEKASQNPFIPFAEYDPSLEQIRIELRDCSVTERPLDGLITVMIDNHADYTETGFAGAVIDCHVLKFHGMSEEGIKQLATSLDKFVKAY